MGPQGFLGIIFPLGFQLRPSVPRQLPLEEGQGYGQNRG